jgi:hypothetical protein
MNILLERYDSGAEDTLGNLYINGVLQCKTLEDQYRAVKVKGDTRIPEGTYEIKLRKEGTHHLEYSQNLKYKDIHKGMLWLQNVPGFQYILIHVGNSDKDTEGCILVGTVVVYGDKPPRRKLLNSALAYRRIYPPIAAAIEKGEKVTITIKTKHQ